MRQLVQGFVHDIRSSLGIIQGCLDTENDLDPKVSLDMARRHTAIAIGLMNQLEEIIDKKIAPRIAVKPITSKEIRELLHEFLPLYPAVEVRYDCPKNFTINADINILRRVIDNCITNALKAGRAQWIMLSCNFEEDVVRLAVKDDGCGMSREQLSRLGLGFSTTGGGRGSGILIELLSSMGGTITWHSIKDVGTCTQITFLALPAG